MRISKAFLLASALALTGAAPAMAQGRYQDQEMQRLERGPMIHLGHYEVRTIQRLLRSHGQRVGVDGVWGPGTTRALRNFQRDMGLRPTGNLNLSTLRHLGIEVDIERGGRGGPEFRDEQEMREKMQHHRRQLERRLQQQQERERLND